MSADTKDSKRVEPMYILGILAAVGIGLFIFGGGLDFIGEVIDRRTKAILIILIIAGLAGMFSSGKKPDDHPPAK